MQPDHNGVGGGGRGMCGVRAKLACAAQAGVLTLALTLALTTGARAEDNDDTPNITGASNGGVASATTGGNISIGTIVTGENTGNSIQTGNISGPAELNGGEIDYPTNVNVSQDLSSPIATADGGDGGVASPPFDGSDVTVDINNRDRNNNRSSAVGTGEGGAGGAGGTGGDVTVTTTP